MLLYVVDVQLGLSPGEWRRLYSEQLYGLCCSPVISRVTKWWRMRWVWHVARMGEGRGAYRVLVRERGGKNTFEMPRLMRKNNLNNTNNIKMKYSVGCEID